MMPMKLDPPETPKYYGPFEARAKLMNLQNLAQQQQIGQQSLEEGKLKLAEQQRLVGEGQKIRDVLQNSPDLRSALPNIYKINPVLGTSMMKSLHDQEKSELDMETARIGQSAAKAKRLASLAGSATDEDSYHRAINTAVDEKLMSVQEAHEHLSKGWGPQSQAEMQQAVQMGLTAEEQAKQRLDNLKEQRDALDAKHKQELAGVNTLQKQIEITVQTMPPVDPQTGSVDPQEWAKWRAEAPPAVQAKIPPAPSPVAIALMKRMGLTPDQQRQAEQAAATLAETKYGKSTPYPPPVQAQKVEEAGAMAGARTNVLLSPQKEAQEIRIAGAKAEAVAEQKPPTQPELKALNFHDRMRDSENVISDLEKSMVKKNVGQQTWFEYAPNFVQSETNQLYRQAQRQFTEARLRKESGAMIAPSEYANDRQTYFPQPGDTAAVLERKRKGREVLLKGLRRESGRAYEAAYGAGGPAPASDTGAKPATHRYNPATGQIEEIK